ncbi:MAG: GNAT family N-acetyltransferase [Christensenellaceae bacterium]|jgi:GNAT superfamily N-acetyltransferase|nr:GNAT family N-acetyltransferase [Christensenellaceae bacterium]
MSKMNDIKLHSFFNEALTKTFNKEANNRNTHVIMMGEDPNDSEYSTVNQVTFGNVADVKRLIYEIYGEFGDNMPGMIFNMGRDFCDPLFRKAKHILPKDYQGIIMCGKIDDLNANRGNKSEAEVFAAKEKDLPQVNKIYNDAMNAPTSPYYDPKLNYDDVMKKILTKEEKGWGKTILLAREKIGGKIAGILIGVHNEEMAYLNDLAVLPEFQHKGIAGQLTECFTLEMKKLGIKEMLVDTLKDDVWEKRFHERTNQKICNQWGFEDRIESFQTNIPDYVKSTQERQI